MLAQVSAATSNLRLRKVAMIVANPCDPDWRVMKEARSLADAGFLVTIIAWDRDGTRKAHDAVGRAQILRLRSPYAAPPAKLWLRIVNTLRFWLQINSVVRRLGYDIVHCHDLPTLPLGVLLTVGRRQKRLVYDAHEVYWLMAKSTWPPALVWLAKHSERWLAQFATTLITVSNLATPYFRGHPNLVVVGNWYDPIAKNSLAGSELRRQLGIGQESFCLACVGTLAPRRLINLLIESAPQLRGVDVVVAGRGPSEATLIRATLAIGNLHFVGWQAQPERIYAAADALFYGLSMDDEYGALSSPNTLFLSIAMEIPLITVALGQAGLVIRKDGGGIVLPTPTPDALARAIRTIREPDFANQAKSQLRALQLEYNWAKASQRLIDAYNKLWS